MTLQSVVQAGPFSFSWPDGTIEQFTRTWTGEAAVDGASVTFRHGIGLRPVYGRDRVHTVTWLQGEPVVEGVEADDYPRSHSLLSRIKRDDKKLARRLEEVPTGYEAFTIVNHWEEVDAPYSPRGLAVKIVESDVESWVKLALLRRAPDPFVSPRAAQRRRGTADAPTARFEAIARDQKLAVAESLVAFEVRENGPLRQAARELTPDREAEAVVRRNAFAFLLAVIFDQNVDFERAWRAPLLLEQRLGHCDPYRMVADPEEVYRAVSTSPKLGRFHNNLGRWAVAAAERVIEFYGGDVSSIWTDVTASALQGRLAAFDGISQKKAAMTTMLLWRFMDVPIREMNGCDVAVDIHLRRVFLRAGLVERDSVGDMIAAARSLYPTLPGALDPPAWTVGRKWCRPSAPDCPACPLVQACPKLIDRAVGVTGA